MASSRRRKAARPRAISSSVKRRGIRWAPRPVLLCGFCMAFEDVCRFLKGIPPTSTESSVIEDCVDFNKWIFHKPQQNQHLAEPITLGGNITRKPMLVSSTEKSQSYQSGRGSNTYGIYSKSPKGIFPISYQVRKGLEDIGSLYIPMAAASLKQTPSTNPTTTDTVLPWQSPSPRPASPDPNPAPAYSAEGRSAPRIRRPAPGPMQLSAPRPPWGASPLVTSPLP